MTREEAIKVLSDIDRAWRNFSQEEYVALEIAIKALEQEPCEDAISRLAVLESIKNLYPDMPVMNIMGARRKWLEKYAPYFECEKAVEHLPPVTPKQKTGHWIDEGIYADGCNAHAYRCSECGEHIIEYEPDDSCKFCGADMRESE